MQSAEGRFNVKSCLGEGAWQGQRRKEREKVLATKGEREEPGVWATAVERDRAGGGRGGAEGQWEGPPARRRLRGKQPPPQAMQLKLQEAKEWSRGHRIRKVGRVVFCTKCGSHAWQRFGKGLQADCKPPDNAAQVRLRRLHEGRHPIKGTFL